MNELIRKVPVEAGSAVEGTEFQNLAVNIGLDENSNDKFVIVALCNGDEPDEDAAFFAIESAEQVQAIIDCLKAAMEDAFQDD